MKQQVRIKITMQRRAIKAYTVIVIGLIVAVLMTILYDFIVSKYGHEVRFQWIFGLSGGVCALFNVFLALYYYTDNFGEGSEWQDEQDCINSPHNNDTYGR